MSEGQSENDAKRRGWVALVRVAVVQLGFLWVLGLGIHGCVYDSNHGRDATFVIIGIMFMLSIVFLPALICAVLLPTHRLRLFVTPCILVGCLLFVSSRGSNINYPSVWGMAPWILAGTAISLMVPELPFMSWLYHRLFGSISR